MRILEQPKLLKCFSCDDGGQFASLCDDCFNTMYAHDVNLATLRARRELQVTAARDEYQRQMTLYNEQQEQIRLREQREANKLALRKQQREQALADMEAHYQAQRIARQQREQAERDAKAAIQRETDRQLVQALYDKFGEDMPNILAALFDVNNTGKELQEVSVVKLRKFLKKLHEAGSV